MNTVIISEEGELIAFISDTYTEIIKRGYDIIHYGDNEPVFEAIGDRVYVQENKFIVDLKE